MSFYRHLLIRSLLNSSRLAASDPLPFSLSAVRPFAFSSAEEAAAERRRRKRRLRIEPPISSLRAPNTPRPPRDPNAPRLPDSTSALTGPRLNLHNRVQTLIRSGDLDGASATARHAVFSSTRPTVFTCNALIASMHRAHRHDDAVALFTFFFNQSRIIPNVVSYNILINTHCDAGRVDVGLDIYRHIIANAPFNPSYVTYRHLTKGLVDAGRINEAVDLLREMLHNGHGADSIVYNTLIAGYIDIDNMDRAFELFDELKERCLVYDGIVHTTFMEAYFKQGRDKDAMDSYQSLLDRQFKMSPATCNALLETLLKHDKVDEANNLFDDMISNHTPPSFTALNTDTYNIMVNQSFKMGKFQDAIEVFHRQGKKPFIMDVGCFNNIIGKLCQNGLILEAEKLFEEMPGKSVNPDATTYSFLIDEFFRKGRAEDALKYFEKMVNSGDGGPKVKVDFYNKMFDGLEKAGLTSCCLEIFSKMGERGLTPNAASYEILVTGFCREGGLEKGLSLLEEMARKGVAAATSSNFREFVIETFDRAGLGMQIQGIFPAGTVHAAPQAQQAAA